MQNSFYALLLKFIQNVLHGEVRSEICEVIPLIRMKYIWIKTLIRIFFRWAVGPWSPCSQTCGLGRKYRSAQCVAQQQDGQWKQSPVDKCSKDKPETLQICVEKSCYLNWRTGPWSKVSGPVFCFLCRTRLIAKPIESNWKLFLPSVY